MDRRGFLKQAGALAVCGAFPLPPAPALTAHQIIFEQVPIHFDCALGESGIALASPAFIEAMERVWRQCTRQPA